MSDPTPPSIPPAAAVAAAAAAAAVTKALGELKPRDHAVAEAIAAEICKYAVDFLALLGLPFSHEALTTALLIAGHRANIGPNTLDGWKQYREEEAPQAIERLAAALVAGETTDKLAVQSSEDSNGG